MMRAENGQITQSDIDTLKAEIYQANTDRIQYPAFDQNLNQYAQLFARYEIGLRRDLEMQAAHRNAVFIDLGCGEGNALIQAQRDLAPQFRQFIGITTEGTVRPVVPEGIAIFGADLQDPRGVLLPLVQRVGDAPIEFCAVYLTRYLADPMTFLEELFNMMRVGDMAHVYEFPLAIVKRGTNDLDEDGIEQLMHFLATYGIELVRRGGVFDNAIRIRKTENARLQIPVVPERIVREAQRLLYRFI